MPGHSKWSDVQARIRAEREQKQTHHYTARHEYRPWWGLGLVKRWHEIHMTYDGDEADALRSLATVFSDRPGWVIERVVD